MKYQIIAKGAIYHVFARKLTWYFIGVYIIKPNNNVTLVLAKGRRISNFLEVHTCIASFPDLTVYRKLLARPFVANQILSLLDNWSLSCANKIYDSLKSRALSKF